MKNLFVLLIILQSSLQIEFQFRIPGKQEQCFGQTIEPDTLVVGEVLSDSVFFTVVVYDGLGAIQFRRDSKDSQFCKYSFNTHHDQTIYQQNSQIYQICVKNTAIDQKLFKIILKIGIDAKDYKNIASGKDFNELESMINQLSDQTYQVLNANHLIIKLQEYHLEFADSINDRYTYSSIFLMAFTFGITIYQGYFFKQFLKEKKEI